MTTVYNPIDSAFNPIAVLDKIYKNLDGLTIEIPGRAKVDNNGDIVYRDGKVVYEKSSPPVKWKMQVVKPDGPSNPEPPFAIIRDHHWEMFEELWVQRLEVNIYYPMEKGRDLTRDIIAVLDIVLNQVFLPMGGVYVRSVRMASVEPINNFTDYVCSSIILAIR